MKVRAEVAGPCRKTLSVEASVEETRVDHEQAVRDIVKVARVDGFRKGKAPRNMVEVRFRKEIEEEARDRLVPRLYREALAKEEITPVAIVKVEDLAYDPAKGISFKVTVDVPPDFDLPKYRKIVISREAPVVTEAQVDETIEHLRDSRSKFVDVTGRTSRAGDLVLVDYAGTCDGEPIARMGAEYAGVGEGKDAWVLLEGPEFIPGFTQGLTGCEMGASLNVDVEFPSDYHVKGMAGRKARYQVQVKGLRERIKPEINAEFLKEFGVETLETLKERIRTEMQADAVRRERSHARELLAQELLKQTPFDLPQSIVEEEVRMTVREIVRRNVMQGASQKQIEERKDDILQAATRTSEERVRLSYVLARIAEEEKVEVSEEELNARLTQMASRYRMDGPAFRAEVEKRNGLESIRSDLRAEKALDMLLDLTGKSKEA